MEVQVLLKKGAVRRVGTGTTINILEDPWLPGEDPYVHTFHEVVSHKTVDVLMNSERTSWDIDLVKDIFDERDANLILSIPLNCTDLDAWFWRYERLGQYSVNSAYNALRDSTDDTNRVEDSVKWKQLWNLKIPFKVKHFVWRAIKNVLPTKEQLLVKRVPVLAMCPVCNLETETVFHSLVLCHFAKLCWGELNINITSNAHTCFKGWITNVLQRYDTKEIEEVVMVCWAIWRNRNAIVWRQYGSESSEVCKSAKLFLNQWKNAQDKSFSNSLGFMTQEDGHEHWVQPRNGMIKINVDAAIFENSGKYCLSMVARDCAGDLVEAATKCRHGTIAPELAEAIGIKEALSWIKTKVTQPVIVESDCLAVIQAIRCSTVNLSYLGRIIDECKSLVSELKNRHVTLNFVKRSANKVAHFLARHNSSIADRSWFGGDAYPELYQVICNDLKS